MLDRQKTLKSKISLNGTGLHTGLHVEITLKPAPENHGIVFQRTDLDNKPYIHALAEYVTDTARGTTLEQNGAKIATMEHCLSAIKGLDIDNVLIEINAPELPILDGSARYYVEAITNAGIVEQSAAKTYFVVDEKIEYKIPEKGVEITLYPHDGFDVDVLIDYNSKVLGYQYASYNEKTDYKKEIANCRTFVFLHELEPLLKHNLIKGGDLDNAIVIIEHKISQEELDKLANLFHKPKIAVKPEGILNNLDLHFPNEPARHKLLDVIGDLALTGVNLKAKVIAKRPGHLANTELAKIIRNKLK